MKNKLTLALLAVCLGCFAGLKAQSQLDVIRRDYIGTGDFQGALLKLYEYRPVATYKFPVDIFISICHCKTGNVRSGKKILVDILGNYNLSPKHNDLVKKALTTCANGSIPPEEIFSFALRMTSTGTVGAGVGGKTGGRRGGGTQVNTEQIRIIRDIPLEKLEARLLKSATQQQAAEQVNINLQGKLKMNTVVSGNIIASAPQDLPQNQLLKLATRLNGVQKFYSEYFNLPVPPYMITAYIAGNFRELDTLAVTLHGIRTSWDNLGYSVVNDMSILSDDGLMLGGTEQHELMHLMLNFHYPYIPPVFSEGIPALFEGANWNGTELLPGNNWRGDILEKCLTSEPYEITRLDSLLKMSWPVFDTSLGLPGTATPRPGLTQVQDGELSLSQQMVNHATARYFIFYLFEKETLPAVMTAIFANYSIENQGDVRPAMDIVCEILETTPEDLQAGFDFWLKRKLGLSRGK